MAGRGRGRGGKRGYTPPTGAQLFLRRSAEECGLDARNLRSLQDITRPSLFPDLELHSSGDNRLLLTEKQSENGEVKQEKNGSAAKGGGGLKGYKRSAQTTYLRSKSWELHNRMQSSVFYVRPTKDVPDVVRYGDQKRPPPVIDHSAVLSHCLGGRVQTKRGRYVPEELVGGQRRGGAGGVGSGKGEQAGLSLEELAAREKQRQRMERSGEVEEGEEGEEELVEEQEEEEEGEDYVMNYYESEGDESVGADGEPIF